jgi:hypothetical protein
VIQSLSSRSQHPLAFASYSPFTGSLSNPPTADFSPFICCDYFGLAKNQESVIEITKSRDDGHLPWR